MNWKYKEDRWLTLKGKLCLRNRSVDATETKEWLGCERLVEVQMKIKVNLKLKLHQRKIIEASIENVHRKMGARSPDATSLFVRSNWPLRVFPLFRSRGVSCLLPESSVSVPFLSSSSYLWTCMGLEVYSVLICINDRCEGKFFH